MLITTRSHLSSTAPPEKAVGAALGRLVAVAVAVQAEGRCSLRSEDSTLAECDMRGGGYSSTLTL